MRADIFIDFLMLCINNTTKYGRLLLPSIIGETMRVKNIEDLKNFPIAASHKAAIAKALNEKETAQRNGRPSSAGQVKADNLKDIAGGGNGALQQRLSMLIKADDYLGQLLWIMDFTGAVPGRKFEIDFASPELKLGLELDGYQFHGKHKKDFYRDREKDFNLSLNGWQVYRVQAGLLYKDPNLVIERARSFVTYWKPRQEWLRDLHPADS
jgi:very-short-patch-repair endonuclease